MLKEAYELSLSHKRKPVLLITSRCSRSFIVHYVTKTFREERDHLAA
jgi:hypothetical protein